ncbi:MAG: anthranilate phosphoribosyltransferase [Planctomycetota bacterium]|nr:MAG: anthranilate phosphoribosyltransferase [Planctomycetota bacterium]
MIKDVLDKLLNGIDLEENEAAEAMTEIMDGRASPTQMAAYLVALRAKGESISELAGSLRSMRSFMRKVDIGDDTAIDLCGTGGDGKGTFNISTTSAFVVAGAGVKVAKHGNRAASSQCGSADLLEELGVTLTLEPEQVAHCISEVGMGFMFAPAFHPAMKNVAPVRKELGVRTIFNMLGPLANPAGVTKQMVGVFNPALMENFAHALGRLGGESAVIVHCDGYDEATTTGPVEVALLRSGEVTSIRISPEELGLAKSKPEALTGGTAANNAQITKSILSGEEGPRTDTVLLNSALALYAAGKIDIVKNGIDMARVSIASGKAINVLNNLVDLSNSFG